MIILRENQYFRSFVKPFFLMLFFVGTAMQLVSQVYVISNEETETCSGVFVDAGNTIDGVGNPYPDENFTYTMCPDNPGDAISVSFVAFGLQTNPNGNNSDYLYIYDGPDTGSPSMGSYTGNTLQGLPVTATINNPTGCLTFVFQDNGPANELSPGWEANISCTTPCATPIAASSIVEPPLPNPDSISVGVCLNQEVIFGDNGSTPGIGFNLDSWIWNFDDGSIDTLNSGSNISHVFSEPGEYIVSLAVLDNNGCVSLNLQPLQVLVSTIPLFNSFQSTPVCAGSPAFVDGNPVQSVTWTALPPQVVAGETYLADGAGFSYSSDLNFDFFEEGATLENCDDLLSVTVNMEHSYMGDLDLTITCPDGTTVALMSYPNGGGGCFLGEAVDDGSNTPGTGYNYGWSPNPDIESNINDNANWTQIAYTDNAGNNMNSNIANPGIYASEGDLCDFVGCPLNGTWTFSVLDNLAIDNGYIFEWGLNLNPILIPGVTTFTPTIGLEADSSFWTGPGIIDQDFDANYCDIVLDTPGFYDYVFTVTNNFSCTFDTTLTIEVVEGPENNITAGPDQIFCGDPVNLQGAFLGDGISPCAGSSETVVHCYDNDENTSWLYCPDNIGDGTMMEILFYDGQIEGFFDHIQVFDGDDNAAPLLLDLTGDYPESFVTATNPDGCLFVQFTSDGSVSCGSGNYDPVSWCAGCGEDACGFLWSWEPADNLTNANTANPTVNTFDGIPTEYVAFVEPVGLDNCATTDTVFVIPGFDFTTSFSNPTCVLTDGTIVIEINEPPSDGPWTADLYENGVLVETINSNGGFDVFDDLVEGNYSVTLSDAAGCEYEVAFVLSPPQPMDFDLTPNPNICINGFATLETSSDMDPSDSWTYTWDNGLNTGDVQIVNPVVDTDYTVFATDPNGCTSDIQIVTVQVYDSLNVSLNAPDLICGGAFAELEADAFNGGSGAGYSFDWTWQSNSVGGDENYWVDYPEFTGTYCVTLSDNCETPAVTACEEVVIETPIPADFTSDTTRSCVPGVFQFESLVDPDLIDQTEWFFGDGELAYESDPAHAYLNPGSYDITFNITSLIGCEYTNFQPNYLQVFTPPYVGFTATPQPTRVPDTEVQFESVNSSNVVDWFWLFDSIQNLGASSDANPAFEFPYDHGGNYPVTLSVTDENGCTSQITRTIEVLDLFSLYIPTSFTPNNDGNNDAFYAVGTDIDPNRFSMQVINRWGNLVFETSDMNEAWYGNANDASEHYAADGVYFYRVVVYSVSNPAERKEIKGSVTLMR
jgi:gliding motility-associated-like protein